MHSNQYGFLPGSDTAAATTDAVTNLQNSLNSGHLAAAIFIDVSKAFDSVVPQLLIDKADRAGIRGPANHVLNGLLTGRCFNITLQHVSSDYKQVTTGVPQGSVIGPIAFILYINDLFQLPLHGKPKAFADDFILMYDEEDEETMASKMKEDLQLLYDWFCANSLAMNVEKTKYMIFADPRKQVDLSKFDLTVNDTALERVDEYKYLGLHLTSSLNWSSHVNFMATKIASMVGALRKVAPYLHQQTLLSVYYAHIHSHLVYMAHIWGSTSNQLLNILRVLQNKAIRVIFQKEYSALGVHTVDIYKRYGILPVQQLVSYSAAVMMYKIKNNLIKSDIELQLNENFHGYDTRRKNDLHLPKPRNETGKAALPYRGATIFNDLPKEIREVINLFLFKKRLKAFYVNSLN